MRDLVLILDLKHADAQDRPRYSVITDNHQVNRTITCTILNTISHSLFATATDKTCTSFLFTITLTCLVFFVVVISGGSVLVVFDAIDFGKLRVFLLIKYEQY